MGYSVRLPSPLTPFACSCPSALFVYGSSSTRPRLRPKVPPRACERPDQLPEPRTSPTSNSDCPLSKFRGGVWVNPACRVSVQPICDGPTSFAGDNCPSWLSCAHICAHAAKLQSFDVCQVNMGITGTDGIGCRRYDTQQIRPRPSPTIIRSPNEMNHDIPHYKVRRKVFLCTTSSHLPRL